MKYIIDTSTWVSLVRYYSPFDKGTVIYDFFKKKLETNSFELLSEVSDECKFVSQKMVVKELNYIAKKDYITKTEDLLPYPKFFNLLENQFCNRTQRDKLESYEVEGLTDRFLQSADAKIILKALKIKKGGLFDQVTVVTEETSSDNDNKLYRKIPKICDILDINCISLPALIKQFDDEINLLVKAG